jgi:acyl dehydratase
MSDESGDTTAPSRPTVGQRATWTRTFGAAEVEAFAALTGDRNPLHFEPRLHDAAG